MSILSWARGYRAGSKILRLATFMDLLCSVMQFIFYLYIAKFYQPKWYAQFEEGGPERLFFSYIRCMHAVCLLLYAAATYLLEVYHDEGAGDLHAYLNSTLFGFAGLIGKSQTHCCVIVPVVHLSTSTCFRFAVHFSEFTVMFLPLSGLSTLAIWFALLAATVWAFFFEPEVNNVSPALHETELTNDVEQQVEKFARMSPYYPTEHSMLQSQATVAQQSTPSYVQQSFEMQNQPSIVAQAYEAQVRQ